jgi:hypothetical protein
MRRSNSLYHLLNAAGHECGMVKAECVPPFMALPHTMFANPLSVSTQEP